MMQNEKNKTSDLKKIPGVGVNMWAGKSINKVEGETF